MDRVRMLKDTFVVIHGHFYQPPRENPWIGAIEREESASPFHDWNERITYECYWPNAYARIIDGKGKILYLFNNYASMSFNFGPTLLSWIELRKPHLYRRIIEADRESLKKLGHGNAIAQVYDHIILPLASKKDKETEVLWGIADFERRFGRKPEGIWLPETAVNYSTLQVLVDKKIKFTILSPLQAKRVRSLGSKKWADVSQGKIDTTQPYRCFLKRPTGEKILDQSIDIFFYNDSISKEISFGDLLRDGNLLCDRFREAYQSSKKVPQILNIATDGETFGHHKKFGDMALAFALHQGFPSRGLEITNYGAFLKKFPPLYEVEIDEGPKGEGTSWSCSHGVGRWKEDCGCTTGGEKGWNQKWRKPLREALDFLRDELSHLFEKKGREIFEDVWKARDNYIEILMDRSPQQIKAFFERESAHSLDESQIRQGLKLLEMQRHSLRMYTSCGWFFADIGGLETKIILQHAAKAIELAREFSDQNLEGPFLHILSEAKSNIPELGNGAQIYERFVKTRSIPVEQVVNHFTLASLNKGKEKKERKIFSFFLEEKKEFRIEEGERKVFIGEVEVTNEPILERRNFLVGTLFSQKDLFRTWIRENPEAFLFDQLKEELQRGSQKGVDGVAETFFSFLGSRVLSFRDTLKEMGEELIPDFIQKELEAFLRMCGIFFEKNRDTLNALIKEGFEIPYELRIAAEITLSQRLLNEIKNLSQEFKEANLIQGEIDQILTEAEQYGYHLNREKVTLILNELLKERAEILFKHRDFDLSNFEGVIQEIIAILEFSERWGFDLDQEEAQSLIGEMLDQLVSSFESYWWGMGKPRPFTPVFLTLAEKMNFNTERFLKMVRPLQSTTF
ncbi:MAG: DUF3536 domain-containing protein [Thermodesulfobacteriota bacterium]